MTSSDKFGNGVAKITSGCQQPYNPGKDNIIAILELRKLRDETEWMLDQLIKKTNYLT